MLIWYHDISMGPFSTYITKKYNYPLYGRHTVVIIAGFAQIADFQWNIGKIEFFSTYRYVTKFCAYKRRKWRS